MKKIMIFKAVAVSLLFSFSAYGQQMPAGNVMQSVNCSLADGVDYGEMIQWFRDNPLDPGSQNLVFMRIPVIMNSNFLDDYDFRLVTYYGPYANYVSQIESRIGRSGPRTRPTPLPRDMFSCDRGTRNLSLVRNVPDGDTFDGPSTLLTARLCLLNEGVSQADAYEFVTGVAERFRNGGNNALMQVGTRAFGPIQNVSAGGAVLVTSVASDADSMAERLDLLRDGLGVGQGIGDVMACRHPSLWRSHAVYRPN